MSDITIRPAVPEDAAAVCALINPIIRDTTITFTTDEKLPEAVFVEIQSQPGSMLVLEDGGHVVGSASLSAFRKGPGYAATAEHSIVLGPQARGRGYGRLLLEALIVQAREHGVHCLIAGVSGENPGAVTFHQSLGFAEVARLPEVGRKFDRWIDLILMQKFL